MWTVNTYGGGEWSTRPAWLSDVDRLAEIVLAATKDQGRWSGTSPEEERQWLDGFAGWSRETIIEADPHNELHVITDGQRKVFGRLRVVRSGDTSAGVTTRIGLAGLQLLPAAQGHGIGTVIIKALQREAASAHCSLDIGVEKDNPGARRLYERLGCVQIGEDDKWYKFC